MGFTPYSKVVEPALWSPPLSENVLMSGAIFNEKNMKENQQNLQNSADSFLSIQTNIPQDAQVLNQRKQEFQNAVKGLNLSNLNNPQTVSQLNQLITKFSTDPDILGIAQRANKLNKDLKDIKDLEEKGKFVPAWKMKSVLDANEYANSGQYLRDKRFSGQIRAGFDWDKHNKDLISSTPEIEILKKSGGNNDLYKGKTYNALQGKFYEGLKQPGALDDLREQFEYNYGDQDYSSHDQQLAISQVNKLNNIIATSNDPILVNQAKADLDYWSDFSSSVNPQTSKEDAFQRYIRANAEDFARTNTNYALKESKINDVYKMQQDLANQKAVKLYDLQLESGVNPKDYASVEGFIKAATDKIQQNKKDIESQKQEGRMSLAQLKSGVKQGKVGNPDNVVIEEFGFTPKEIRTKLSEGNLPVARMIIENNPSLLGISKDDYNPNKLTVDSDTKQIKYDEKVVNIKFLMDEINTGVSDNTTEVPYYSISGNSYIFYSPTEGTIVLPKNDTILNDFLKEHPEAVKK